MKNKKESKSKSKSESMTIFDITTKLKKETGKKVKKVTEKGKIEKDG